MYIKVGVTTSVLDQRNWFDQLNKLPSRTIEIGGRSARLFFDPGWIEKIGKKIAGYDLSFHSGTVKIFLSEEQYTQAEIERLKAEIVVCNKWKIKELVFHLKHEKLEKKEISQLQEIVKFAQSYDVELLYEANGCLVADVTLDLLEKFPDINYNLDLGHLNVGIETKRFGHDLNSFLKKIDKRTTYVHAHNNQGKDSHTALKDGSLDWKHVLKELHHVKKIITETRTIEDNQSDIDDINKFIKESAK